MTFNAKYILVCIKGNLYTCPFHLQLAEPTLQSYHCLNLISMQTLNTTIPNILITNKRL